MAVSKTTTISALAGTLVVDLDADANEEDNVTGATSGLIYAVDIDNTVNAVSAVYVKIADTSNATVSSTKADLMLIAPAGKSVSYILPYGHAYSSGVSFWCTTGNADASTSAPTKSVKVRILCT